MSTAAGAAFSLIVMSIAAAQDTGSIRGNLLDPNGSIVTGLDTPIYATHVESDSVYSADVSSDGWYALDGLRPGVYSLSFPIPCCMYQTYSEESVELSAGDSLAFDLELEWGMNLGTIGDDPAMLSNDMRANVLNVDAPVPRMPDGTPDLSGVWVNIPIAGPRERPAMQPWALEIERQLREMGVDPIAGAYCLRYSAVPTTLRFPYKLVQTADLIVQIMEFVTPAYRQIFLDGRERPEFWNPAWYGHSVGHWEGDTLVVETVGFNEITPGFGIHSESLRVVERYTRTSFGRMEIEIIAEDPEAYIESFVIRREAGIAAPDQEILEFVCAENNDREMNINGLPWRGRP
jgi:hypothetical protein